MIYDGSLDTDNKSSGIVVSAGLSKFVIRNNVIRSSVRAGTKRMRFGISIGDHCENFSITNNEMGNFGESAWNLGLGHANFNYEGNRIDGDSLVGLFKCDRGLSTIVRNKNVHPYTVVTLAPMNAQAATLQGVFQVPSNSSGKFTLAHSRAAGTETFQYTLRS
jgi:hypothetical protein